MIKNHHFINKLHIAVIGGNGFIGRHFIHRLANQENVRIWSLDKRDHNTYLGIKDSKAIIQQVQIDVSSNGLFAAWLAANDVDAVIFCAGQESHTDGLHPSYYSEVSTLQALNEVLKALDSKYTANPSLEKVYFQYLSSSTIYGSNRKKLSKEIDPLYPSNYSGMLKLTAEDLINRVVARHQIPSTILRLSEVYGKHSNKQLEKDSNWHGYLQHLVDQVILRVPTVPIASPNTSLDLVNVNYVTNVMASCLRDVITGVYNVGSGQNITIRELCDKVVEAYNEPLAGKIKVLKDLTIENQLIDCTQIHSILPYDSEKYDLDKFLDAYIPVRRYEIAKSLARNMILNQKYTLDATAYGAVKVYYERQRERLLNLQKIKAIAGSEFEKIDYGRFQERARLLLTGQENKLEVPKALEQREKIQLANIKLDGLIDSNDK